MEIKKLADNLGLDVEDYNELLDLFIETASSDLHELKEGLEKEDVDVVHERSHSIKGSAGNLGLIELFELAKTINDRTINNTLEGINLLADHLTERLSRLNDDFNKFKDVHHTAV